CITICNMENIDPVGIHTGDSIVVAPSQTLTDVEYHMLRSAAIKIISALGVVGGCNIQFALDPKSKKYYLIEVNPRVSRSSALASKATGYPIARMAAKLAVGYTLAELVNPVTGHTYASFEPALDYVVVKFPRFPFDKFSFADRRLGTQMKATGEVMAIDRNFERALQKALHSLELDHIGLYSPALAKQPTKVLVDIVKAGDDRRFFAVLELLRRGIATEQIHEWTKIDLYFLTRFAQLIALEQQAKETTLHSIDEQTFRMLKEKGFSDAYLAYIWNVDEKDVREKRKAYGIVPSYKMVDTCAAEFSTETSYYYSTYFGESEIQTSDQPKMLILGSGPIRIGQGVEFDYSSVHCVYALQQAGYEAILMNNNPETVSTDFTVADRLYFEPLTVEDVLNVVEAENVEAVIVQFGGQTAINLANKLESYGVSIIGMNSEIIDQLEDRERFYALLQSLDIPHVKGTMANDKAELMEKVERIGYPLLLSPSYVIGGRGMHIVYDEQQLASLIKQEMVYQVLIDEYVRAKEGELDAICDGHNVFVPTIIEHVEKTGVHSGDSYALLPAQSFTEEEKAKMIDYTERITNKLHFKGLMNVQFIVRDGEVYVLEVNPRASRTVPIVSKVTGVPMVQLATNVLLGKYLSEDVKQSVSIPYVVLKYPVFSTYKLPGVDPLVGPEMKSTGEGISIAKTVQEAAYKAFYPYLVKKKEAYEIYVDAPAEAKVLIEHAKQQGLTIVTDEPFERWVEKKEALAFVSFMRDEQSAWRRKQALARHVLVLTEEETAHLFVQAWSTKHFSVCSIQDWLKNLREVVRK
ncbi:MAG: carbamoyl phosphate synthase large subunit, partial [Anoxybacillus ayderensis]|nr:carbamoyl phosphate synthase large subunit [Anoxybacillus ayderensis]